MSRYTLTREHFTSTYSENLLWAGFYCRDDRPDVSFVDADTVCAAGIKRLFNIKIKDRKHDNLPYRLEFVITKHETEESVPLSEIITELLVELDSYEISEELDSDGILNELLINYKGGERHVTCYILPDEYPDS